MCTLGWGYGWCINDFGLVSMVLGVVCFSSVSSVTNYPSNLVSLLHSPPFVRSVNFFLRSSVPLILLSPTLHHCV